ncbi:hypothetical protein L195_g028629 [Trifolium pratense]|uniref:Uncharacterized protein n=1 Tax=Trifolium pratense TaxID=57577 RepID=A0A2K3L2G8_TRIPR|nr:hypothetical protein L195_g028629 [Trifolium pratense]
MHLARRPSPSPKPEPVFPDAMTVGLSSYVTPVTLTVRPHANSTMGACLNFEAPILDPTSPEKSQYLF